LGLGFAPPELGGRNLWSLGREKVVTPIVEAHTTSRGAKL